MNLMFWKKKTGTGDSTEKSQGATEGADKPADPESAEPVIPEKPDLAARIKAQFTAVTMRFKKTPTPDAGDNEGMDADAQHGSSVASEGASENTPDIGSKPSRKHLIIGGAIGTLVLLLTAFGFAVWKIMLSPDNIPACAEISHAIRPVLQVGISQTEIKALKEKNAELQKQIDALKKEQAQQQPSKMPDQGAIGNAPSSKDSGEISIGNKDPKAAAATLKETIEVMNASSGGYPKKTDK